MSRLTQRNEHDTSYFIPQCFEICDGIGCSEQCNNCHVEESLIEKLGAYEDAEEQGLLLRLPCKVGDTVYFIVNGSRIVEKEIWSFEVYENGRVYGVTEEGYCANFTKLLNTKVFLTKEEAEQKLESMKGE